LTARQKLRALQRSIEAAELGKTKIVHCPYCQMDLDFSPPGPFNDNWQPPTCCADFALAVIAILQRKEMNETKDLAERIQSSVGGSAVFN